MPNLNQSDEREQHWAAQDVPRRGCGHGESGGPARSDQGYDYLPLLTRSRARRSTRASPSPRRRATGWEAQPSSRSTSLRRRAALTARSTNGRRSRTRRTSTSRGCSVRRRAKCGRRSKRWSAQTSRSGRRSRSAAVRRRPWSTSWRVRPTEAAYTTELEVIDAERQARDAATQATAIAEDAAREGRLDLPGRERTVFRVSRRGRTSRLFRRHALRTSRMQEHEHDRHEEHRDDRCPIEPMLVLPHVEAPNAVLDPLLQRGERVDVREPARALQGHPYLRGRCCTKAKTACQ